MEVLTLVAIIVVMLMVEIVVVAIKITMVVDGCAYNFIGCFGG